MIYARRRFQVGKSNDLSSLKPFALSIGAGATGHSAKSWRHDNPMDNSFTRAWVLPEVRRKVKNRATKIVAIDLGKPVVQW